MIDPTPSKKPEGWNEIQLINEVGKIVKSYNTIVFPNNQESHIFYQAAYPDYIFDNTGQGNLNGKPSKLICYDIIKKEDGSIGEQAFSSKKRPRPTLMETQDVILNEGQSDEKRVVQEVYRKIYDMLLRFDCLAPSDIESMNLIRDFERMMEIHARYLERGCHRFIYEGRTPSYFNKNTHYRSRSCHFFTQVEERWYITQDRIDEITIEYLSQQ